MRTRHAGLILKIVTTCALLAFAMRDVRLGDIADQIASLASAPLLAAVLLIVVQSVFISLWRWRGVLALGGAEVGNARLLRIVIASLFFNQLLPSTVGGDGARIVMLHATGQPFAMALQSVVFDRCIGLFALAQLSFGGACFSIGKRYGYDTGISLAASCLLVIAAFLIAGSVLRAVMTILAGCRSAWVRAWCAQLAAPLRQKRILLKLVLGSAVGHAMLSLAMWSTAKSIGVSLPLGDCLAVFPAVLLAMALPFSIAGWGVRESGMIVAFSFLDGAKADALSVSILFGFLHLSIGLIAGLAWLAALREGGVRKASSSGEAK